MSALKTLVRAFSFVYHGLLILFLLAISALAWSSNEALHLEMLPWQGASLTHWLFFCALGGLVALLLAFRRAAAWLFLLWSLAVFAVILRALFGSYHFTGPVEFHRALYMGAGALIAVVGAWWQWRRAPAR